MYNSPNMLKPLPAVTGLEMRGVVELTFVAFAYSPIPPARNETVNGGWPE